MKNHVYVAGAGVISAIGNNYTENLVSLQQEKSGIAGVTVLDTIHKNEAHVGEVKLSNTELQNLNQTSTITRTALLGISAARESMKSCAVSDWKKWQVGLISATTVGGMDKTENYFIDYLSTPDKANLEDVSRHPCGTVTEWMADNLQIRNFVSTINTACSSSVNSIIYGCRLIQHGMLDIAIAGGTDALTRFTLNGFGSLMILDALPCRPFDASRNGLNLGEGAGYLVLVSERVLRQEKLEPLCFVNGFANTNDAYHQTASSPEGRGSFDAMQGALYMSQLKPTDIDYINLHGTATVNNDLSEGTAVKRLFENNIPRLSSTKAYTGHTLGASGAIESVYATMCIQHQCVFPNLRFQQPVPELNIVPQLKYESALPINHVMNNAFGFGGNCSSIIFSKA